LIVLSIEYLPLFKLICFLLRLQILSVDCTLSASFDSKSLD
jgi:hypothetical protein